MEPWAIRARYALRARRLGSHRVGAAWSVSPAEDASVPRRALFSIRAMCRLLGLRAETSSDASDLLCCAPNALRVQSLKHPHGWGIGWYPAGGSPRVRRGLAPASEDASFERAAGDARGPLLVAHVRDASVGPIRLHNTHPFRHGRWLCCHNGTVARFEERRAELEAEIAPALRAGLRGDTDSERCFLLFLTLLSARVPLARSGEGDVVRALGETLSLVRRVADPGAPKASSLNLIVTDGRLFAACRLGRSLFLARGGGRRLPGRVVVASERLSLDASWEELPELAWVTVDAALRVERGVLGA